jgi:plasmid maintenance system antidote protein VapI
METEHTAIGKALFDASAGTTKSHFIAQLGISATHFYDICKGDRRLTWKTAKRLGEITETPALEWLEMQAKQDLAGN